MEEIEYRIEEDSIGSKKIPIDAYYGVQSLRGRENFPITGYQMNPVFIVSFAEIKKAAAIVNARVHCIDQKKADAIILACDEIIAGKLHDQFIVDPVQGSAGTSMNMNANEVIANRAIEILGGKKGDYSIVHPNDDVNYGQSTNDVIPTAGRMTILKLWKDCKHSLELLYSAFMQKAKEFDGIIKMGRTQLQDAVPIRLGQEFSSYGAAVRRGIDRISKVMHEMCEVNLGGTAIGTGLNADITYFNTVVPELAQVSGLPLYQAKDMIDGTQNLDSVAGLSSTFKSIAVALSKIANDLRLMSSGPRCGLQEIMLPPMQNGSSIMPGKVNPVIPEVMNQVCFSIIGSDVTVTLAAEAGQFELNAFEPIIFHSLFSMISSLDHAAWTFTKNCVRGIKANEEHCRNMVESSVGIVTALCPHVGYTAAAEVAKEAIKSGASLKDLILEKKLVSAENLQKILDPMSMTTPGIVAEDLLDVGRDE
ncbi:MAG TPA: aspartate ammonia-lyase [Methanocorpusculum sp.]|nr:aspartate ammonia-lyase [Methanocorpusculum sp.]